MSPADRRRGDDPRYTGPERRSDRRLDALEAQHRALGAGHAMLTDQMADLTVGMREAVADGMRQALTDPAVLAAVWDAAMTQGQRGLHERAGRWIFSRWSGLALLLYMLAQYIGWPAALKALLGLSK